MEERFVELGRKRAMKIGNEQGFEPDDEFISFCQRFERRWFVADMSDDYSRTRSEQAELIEELSLEIERVKRRKFL